MTFPCEPWEFDPACCDLPEDTDEELIARWAAISTQILWAASGRRYGPCPVTVRPCLQSCWGGGGIPSPYRGSDGEWRNFATCGCVGECSCLELCEIYLDGPVAGIEEVIIDSDTLDPDQYRLDRVGTGWRLLRVDGGCWPSCQTIQASCGEEGAFCVTYLKGIALDELAIAAHAELTCELVKSCLPNCVCRLPKNVTAVTRQGVTLTFDNSKTWLRILPMVGAFLDAVNPEDLAQPSTVWSPDLRQTRVMPEVSSS